MGKDRVQIQSTECDRGKKVTPGRKASLSHNGAGAVTSPHAALNWYLRSCPKINLLDVTVYINNPSAWGGEAGELGIQVQPGYIAKLCL